ncbi:protein EXECUTER 2, chloroplastic isoform X1 [Selaginella moellendorffii]|nr:protein EXECUTER 2, chloroplastic isoform X1 [Selaginella moellendorffii]|eukprot:XP_002980519.2 protein EXECUTER 2, chloroplastic isoform X1 [Selaginella moellendorffii]
MAAVAQAPSSSSRGIGVGSTAGFGIGAQHFQRSSSAAGAPKGSSSTGLVCSHKGHLSPLCESPRQHARVWPRSGRFLGDGVNCRCKSEDFDEQQPSSTGDGEAANADAWDRRIESALAGIRAPLLSMLSIAGKKFQQYLLKPRSLTALEVVEDVQLVKEETEWDRWQSFFHEVEEQENLLSVLKFDLEEAVEEEDYSEATRIRNEMLDIRRRDTLGQLMGDLKTALEEERYEDAARIRDETDAGLVGWWAGAAEEGNDPFGRIINITSSQGRLVARGYSARQLVTAAPGVPLFEVFFKKDDDNGYQSQAVYLQRERTGADTTATGSENSGEKNEDGEGDDKVSDDLKSDEKDSLDEGLNRILAFLKGRMPDVKLRVFQATEPDKVEKDLPKIGDQLKSSEDNKKEEELGSSDDGKAPLENQLQEKQGKNAVTAEELVEMSVRLLIGRLMQNVPEDKVPVLPVRIPAKIVNKERDSFVFHIEDLLEEKISTTDAMSSWRLAVTAQPSELTSEHASKVLSQALPVKVSKEVADIIRLAVNYAQRRRGLAKTTAFQRIRLAKSTADPFNALYVGTLAPYSSQVIQLRQKYGNWQEDDKSNIDSDKFEFTEYVEAVKLVGDLHVPAGQVIFRAKTGRGSRLPHRGVYPDELGVVARFKGRGKVAEPGFKNPHWIDGELLLLDGKQGVGFLNGAQLCFVYSVPGQPFLILFRRAMIEENSL